MTKRVIFENQNLIIHTDMSDKKNESDFTQRFTAFVGKVGVLIGCCLLPFLFKKFFATGTLRPNESHVLWLISFLLISFSSLFIFRKTKIPSSITLLFFTLIIFISFELAFRFSVKIFFSKESKNNLAEECNYTYPDLTAYIGHPFLQFTGRPNVRLKGSKALGDLSPFNNFGFVGKDFDYPKPAHIIRIACIGESTTADGYPAFLEKYLNEYRSNSDYKFEVMNFGHAHYTTNHSVVNFLLNVVDFNPDYIVIHHGWNEERIRNAQSGDFRGDYSHDYKSFSEPEIYDRYLIRISAIYRYFKFMYDKSPGWTTLGERIGKERTRIEPIFKDKDELKPFERNISSMIQISIARNIRVVLTTLPHSTDESIPQYWCHTGIEQCNEVTRKVSTDFKDKILFVDLDSIITTKHNEIFTDLGHVNDVGRTMKAETIGKDILKDSKNIAK